MRDLNGPGRALLDALGMVGNLAVDELNEAVTLLRTSNDCDIAPGYREETIELTSEEASPDRRRGDGTKDGSAVDGIA